MGHIAGPQLKAVQAVAEGNSTTSVSSNLREDAVVQPGSASSEADLQASASAALPHLLAAASAAAST